MFHQEARITFESTSWESRKTKERKENKKQLSGGRHFKRRVLVLRYSMSCTVAGARTNHQRRPDQCLPVHQGTVGRSLVDSTSTS